MRKQGVVWALMLLVSLFWIGAGQKKPMNKMLVEEGLKASEDKPHLRVRVFGTTKVTTQGYSLNLCFDPSKLRVDSISKVGTIWDKKESFYFGDQPFFFMGERNDTSGFVTLGCVYGLGVKKGAFQDLPLASFFFTVKKEAFSSLKTGRDSTLLKLENLCNGSMITNIYSDSAAQTVNPDTIKGAYLYYEITPKPKR